MRKRRNKRPGVEYHVTGRFNRNEYVFQEEVIKRIYLQMLKRARFKYSFLERTDLSRLMQWVNSMFARTYNKEMGTVGGLWRRRFWSEIIEGERHRKNVILYIWFNLPAIPTVNDAREYIYSGFYCLKTKLFELMEPPDCSKAF